MDWENVHAWAYFTPSSTQVTWQIKDFNNYCLANTIYGWRKCACPSILYTRAFFIPSSTHFTCIPSTIQNKNFNMNGLTKVHVCRFHRCILIQSMDGEKLHAWAYFTPKLCKTVSSTHFNCLFVSMFWQK